MRAVQRQFVTRDRRVTSVWMTAGTYSDVSLVVCSNVTRRQSAGCRPEHQTMSVFVYAGTSRDVARLKGTSNISVCRRLPRRSRLEEPQLWGSDLIHEYIKTFMSTSRETEEHPKHTWGPVQYIWAHYQSAIAHRWCGVDVASQRVEVTPLAITLRRCVVTSSCSDSSDSKSPSDWSVRLVPYFFHWTYSFNCHSPKSLLYC